jgi:hypothetical protein
MQCIANVKWLFKKSRLSEEGKMGRKISLSSAVVVIALVMLLAGVQGLVWAQGGGDCVPGSSSYHSDCDVNQDGKVDVQDLQLVAARWKQTGTPNGHFGETWSGDVVGAGLAVDNDNFFGSGLYGAGNTGVSGKGGLVGVYGEGLWGVYGSSPVTNTAQAYGVYGETKSRSDGAAGVYGVAITDTGKVYGVYGESKSNYGAGVYGIGGDGVYGVSTSFGAGVRGESTSGVGVRGNSTSGVGVYGRTESSASYAGSFYGRLKVEHPVEGIASDFKSYVAIFKNPAIRVSGDGPDVLALQVGDPKPDQSTNYISFLDDDSIIGAIEGNNNDGVIYKSGGGDFAEMLAAVEGLEPGDVLVIGPDGRLTRSVEPYQASVVGVYSTAPAVLGSAIEDEEGKETGKVPLAIMGVVPVKASAENGPIRPGDLLTTASKPGHAMRADPITVNGVSFYPSGVIIGKALEGLEKGTGVIKMLVMLQ